MSKKLIAMLCGIAAVCVANGTNSPATEFEEFAPGIYGAASFDGVTIKGQRGAKFSIDSHEAMPFGQSLATFSEDVTPQGEPKHSIIVTGPPGVGLRFDVAVTDETVIRCWKLDQNEHRDAAAKNIADAFTPGIWSVHANSGGPGGSANLLACEFANCTLDNLVWLLPDGNVADVERPGRGAFKEPPIQIRAVCLDCSD